MGLCFFFKQKTAYEMRISDWSADVCSSDLCSYSVAWQQATGQDNSHSGGYRFVESQAGSWRHAPIPPSNSITAPFRNIDGISMSVFANTPKSYALPMALTG